ncbi:MAG: methyltransferase domain-containing protein [Burkholderiaceae bacterium]
MSLRPRRMNFGCGPLPAPGWLNSDRLALDGVELCADLRDGLPLRDPCLDYVSCVHVLQDLAYFDVAPALRELRRVLRPGEPARRGVAAVSARSCGEHRR